MFTLQVCPCYRMNVKIVIPKSNIILNTQLFNSWISLTMNCYILQLKLVTAKTVIDFRLGLEIYTLVSLNAIVTKEPASLICLPFHIYIFCLSYHTAIQSFSCRNSPAKRTMNCKSVIFSCNELLKKWHCHFIRPSFRSFVCHTFSPLFPNELSKLKRHNRGK